MSGFMTDFRGVHLTIYQYLAKVSRGEERKKWERKIVEIETDIFVDNIKKLIHDTDTYSTN